MNLHDRQCPLPAIFPTRQRHLVARRLPLNKRCNEKPDLPVLTGLRLVAALSVVMAHGSVIVLFTDARWIPIIGFGLAYFGMSLFFVLSGFVIYLNYAPQFAKLPIGEAALRFAVTCARRPRGATLARPCASSSGWLGHDARETDARACGCRRTRGHIVASAKDKRSLPS
jgi:hypothetical protein